MNTTTISSSFWGLFFWAFIIIKVGGTSLAGWSWLWLLMPIIPVISLILNRTGLMF